MQEPADETLRILFIEDSAADIEFARQILGREGLRFVSRCEKEADGVKAAITEFSPDIVISDYSLPELDGLRALRLCKKLLPDVPFILHTADLSDEAAAICIRAGADDYVLKENATHLPFSVQTSIQRCRALKAGRAAERKLITLSRAVDQSPASIIITDRSGNIDYVNTKFLQVSGYDRDEVIGQTPRILKSGKQSPEFYAELWRRITSGEQWQGELENKKKSGEHYWESVSISPIRDERGAITHFLAIKEDITGLRAAENRLRESNFRLQEALARASELTEKAEAANRAKSEFLANMSHEIRTPMNGVIGMTDLLLDTGLNVEQGEYAEAIRSCGDSLLSLINDILDFSKVEAGQLILESLDFDLRTTLDDAVEILGFKAQEKDLDVVCLVDERVPAFLRGDPGRLRQILFNLIGNAIKFTQRGGISVHVNCLADSEASATLRFDVVDTGIGIASDKLGSIFTKFTQADASTTREFGGSGLGLAICRQLVHLFQGEISVSSEEGKGSTFSFTAEFAKPPADAIKPLPREADLSGARVLVADDFKTNRILVSTLLRSWGCRPDEASDADSALPLLRKAVREGDPYAAALLDMQMPGMDGAELGRLIKADDEIKATRLVMLTSLGKRGDAEKLSGVGFSGYLPKPIRPALLRKCLALVLGREEATGLDRGLITRHTVAETSRRRLRVLVAEDNTTNQIIAIKMLEKLGHVAEAVGNGKEAVESLRRMPYNLVLMDCQMPIMDGFEATRIIRDPGSGVRNPQIPIVALTAHAMKGDRELCLEAGMDDYLSKPVSPQDLAAALDRWSAHGSHAGAWGDAVPSVEEDGLLDFDRQGFLERAMGDFDLATEIAAAFLADSPTTFSQLLTAVSSGDVEAAGKLAHTLKGSSANMGGDKLSRITSRMQTAAREKNLELLTELLPSANASFQSLTAALVSEFRLSQ